MYKDGHDISLKVCFHELFNASDWCLVKTYKRLGMKHRDAFNNSKQKINKIACLSKSYISLMLFEL